MLEQGLDGIRIAVADGHFTRLGVPEVFAAVEKFASALSITRRVESPLARAVRTKSEASAASIAARVMRAMGARANNPRVAAGRMS